MVTKPTWVGCWPVSLAWFSLQPGQFHRRQCSRQPALPRPRALHLRLPRVAQVSADCELRSGSGRRSWGRPSLAHGPGLAGRRRPAPWLVILGNDRAHRAVFRRLRVFWHLFTALVRGCGAVRGCVQRETGFRTWGSCLVSAGRGCAVLRRTGQSVRSGHDLAALRGVFELHQDAGFEAGPFPPGGVILAPGIGSQGGDLRAAVLASVDERGRRAIIRASRAVSDCLKGPSWAASTLRADISAVLTDLGFPLA